MVNKESLKKGEAEFYLNVIDRYVSRPKTLQFESICLYEFAATYQPAYTREYDENSDLEEEFPEETEAIRKFKLINNKGQIKARTVPAVVRYIYFNPLEDPEKYYYALLLLYLPFREENVLEPYPSAVVAFQSLYNSLRKSEDNPIVNLNFTQELDRCIATLAEALLQNENGSTAGDVTSQDVSSLFDGSQPDDAIGHVQELSTAIPDTESYLQTIQGLSSEQRQIFNKISNAVTSGRNGVRVVAMGSGGVGRYILSASLRYEYKRCHF